MTKRDYLEQERVRVRKAQDRNARPIIRVLEENGTYRVVGMTVAGKVFHEVFDTMDAAMLFAKQMEETV